MWRTLMLKSHLQRLTGLFQCRLKSSATNPDPADLIDPVIEPQIQTNDEDYFRSLAQKSSGQLPSNSTKPTNPDMLTSRFVEKASSFAREIRSNPGHIKFREGTKQNQQNVDYFARAVAESKQGSKTGSYANKKISQNQALIDVERKYERINDSELFHHNKVTDTEETKSNRFSRESDEFEEFRSEPRNWDQEINQFRAEKKERKFQKKQFFGNEGAMNSEQKPQASQGQYRLNRGKHREMFVKEKRNEFREKFLDFKKSKVSALFLNLLNVVPIDLLDDFMVVIS